MTDQAEGLRRLFGRNFVRVIALSGAALGTAQSALVAALAGVLAQRGKRVLVIDERRDAGVFGAWHMARAGDLLDVILARKPLAEVLVSAPNGVLALPAARGLAHLTDDVKKQQNLLQAFQRWERPVDIVLIDTSAGGSDPGTASFMPAAHDIVNLVAPEARAITEAYAMIKRMTQQASRAQFHVLLHRVKSADEAQTIFANIARTSRSYLDVSLDYLGALPSIEDISAAYRTPTPSAAATAGFDAALVAIAEAMDRWPLPSDDLGPLDSFLHRWMQSSRLRPKEIRY